MVFWSIVASIIFTVIILILTLVTIQKGYGYKHTIDPPVNESKQQRAGTEGEERQN